MADTDKRLLIRLEADNKKLLTKLDQSQKKIKSFENASGDSIVRATNKLKRQNEVIIQTTARTARAANDSFASARRGVGQLGFQIQDIAVQLQGGQSPLLVLGQQGSQVASIFGPGGAVIGAFLAVGAAIGTALLPSLFKTTDALKKLEIAFSSVDQIIKITDDNVVTLSEKFDRLAAKSEVLSQSQIKVALQDISEALLESREKVLELSESLSPSELGGRFNRTSLLLVGLKAKFEEGAISVEEFSEKLNKLFLEEGSASTALKDIVKDISEISSEAAKLRQAQGILEGGVGDIKTEKEIEQQEKRVKAIQKAADASVDAENRRITSLQNSFFAVQDSLRSESQILKDDYNSKLATIIAFESKFKDATEEAEEARFKLKENYSKKIKAVEDARIDQAKGFAMQSLGVIQSSLDKESGLAKAAFAAQQAIAIPGMVVATEEAATKALSLGPIAGPIAQAAIRALGYSSIGVVAGQTIASFEGGGMTPNGPRAGGMDGKGGMLAMLHPNEKVTDLTRAGNDGDGWKVEVNNYAGAQVSQSIDDNKKVVSIMVEQASNTNSEFGRVMQTKYQNIRPKGGR